MDKRKHDKEMEEQLNKEHPLPKDVKLKVNRKGSVLTVSLVKEVPIK